MNSFFTAMEAPSAMSNEMKTLASTSADRQVAVTYRASTGCKQVAA
ncbi:MAG: hypothetical protein DUW69_000653 [Verrucomicrobia bacterium]|jgi:hypothetical protein|nr:MAG: hypothetical protein DUW69_000653 [Verrucomicrobiota bacterium]